MGAGIVSALEFRRKWNGRLTMPDGTDSLRCEQCLAEGKQHGGFGTTVIFCMGRPFMRVCRTHEKKVKQVWEGACDA